MHGRYLCCTGGCRRPGKTKHRPGKPCAVTSRMHGLGRGRRIWAAFLILPARGILYRQVGIPSGTSLAAYSTPNGTITNDKFCLSRHLRLHLSHWRLAKRSQPGVAASLSYPSVRDESTFRHRGGNNEETSMDLPPSASGANGSAAPLGSSLAVPSAMDRSSRRGVSQTGGIR